MGTALGSRTEERRWMTQVEFPPPTAPAAQPPGPVHAVAAQADVAPLLRSYRSALALAADLPPSRTAKPRWWRDFLTLVRPRWGLNRFLVDHMRARTDQLNRRYCLRLSLGEDDGNDARDREALEKFASSLPPPRGAIWTALPLLAIVGVAQVLVALVGDIQGERETFDQIAGLVDLNPGHVREAVTALLHASTSVVLDLIGIITLSAYVVLRPFVFGFRLKRMLLSQPGALDGRHQASPLGQAATALDIHGQESRLFEALGMAPPSESAFDLKVKAVMAVFLLAAGIAWAGPNDYILLGLVFIALALARGTWLRVQRQRRTVRHDALVSAHAEAG
jgi:hypothetical protein